MAKEKEKKNKSRGLFSDGISYFRSSWEELKKVTTPTRQETVQATMVVMLMMIIVAVYLGLLDLIFNKLMQSILS